MRRYLIDSHVIVWWLSDPARLTQAARAAISDPAHQVCFSAASVWELGLKIAKGKLRMPMSFPTLLEAEGFASLPVTTPHAVRALELPPLHQDPFDRMLVAQALEEDLVFITRDEHILSYSLKLLKA
ncbi:MAG: type II toxin-antitoxin system VapC family toxin [Verrucomicrobiota bacterium]